MTFTIVWELAAARAASVLLPEHRRSAKLAVEALGENPRPDGHVRLPAALYRIRAPSCRIIYAIDDAARVVRIVEVRLFGVL